MNPYTKQSILCKTRGFTLIELLVVIAILGILMAILIPTIGAVRKSSEVANSVARMRSLGDTFMLFANENQGRLPAQGTAPGNRWLHQLAPLLGYPPDGIANGVPIYSGGYELEEFLCPALTGQLDPVTGEVFIARYGFNFNLMPDVKDASGVSIFELGVRLAAITNPPNTVLLATKAGADPGLRPLMFPNHPVGVAANFRSDRNPRAADVGSGNIGSHAYVFCDGHVEVREEFIGEAAFSVNQ